MYNIAIIGSGPAGLFSCTELLNHPTVGPQIAHIDIIEAMPSPFGMVRYGVAPDHQHIKKVKKKISQCFEDSRVRLFCNVEVGTDISYEWVVSTYDVTVLAVGNHKAKRFSLAPEATQAGTEQAEIGTPAIIDANTVVQWYNSHPDQQHCPIPNGTKHIVIVGNGNVAIDVSRILLSASKRLKETDIRPEAAEYLDRSTIQSVTILGRRGPLQAAFSPIELKELTKITGINLVTGKETFTTLADQKRALDAAPPRSNSVRNAALLKELTQQHSPTMSQPSGADKTLNFRFLRSPVALSSQIKGVKCAINHLDDLEDIGSRTSMSDVHEHIPADVIISAIGYAAHPISGLDIDPKTQRYVQQNGKIASKQNRVYTVGWAQVGPRGLIGLHRNLARDLAKRVAEDIETEIPKKKKPVKPNAITAELDRSNIRYISKEDIARLIAAEYRHGEQAGSVRRKFPDAAMSIAYLDAKVSGPT